MALIFLFLYKQEIVIKTTCITSEQVYFLVVFKQIHDSMYSSMYK